MSLEELIIEKPSEAAKICLMLYLYYINENRDMDKTRKMVFKVDQILRNPPSSFAYYEYVPPCVKD